jgi:hypothetical protein
LNRDFSQKPTKATRREGDDGMPWIPQYVGHRGAIWALDIEARKDAQCDVCQSAKSDGTIDSDGDIFMDRMENYYEAAEKQVYGDVQE